MSDPTIFLDKEYEVVIEEIKILGQHFTVAYSIPELSIRAWVRIPLPEFTEDLLIEKITMDVRAQMPALELLKELKEKYEGQTIKVG